MLIGILEAETLPAKVVAEFGSYGDMFERLLGPSGDSLRFRRFAADQGELPSTVDACDAYIITGSRFNAYDDDDWIVALRAFIQRIDAEKTKCIGICFGHQIVAEALGGKVVRADQGWGLGVASFQLHQQPAWLKPATSEFNILVTHQDQVLRMPPEATLLASNSHCPIGGYTLGEHIVCLQGHPEFSKEYLRFLIEKRRRFIDSEIVENALNSMAFPVATQTLADWMLRFLAFREEQAA